MYKKKRICAFIPARSGSKGIINKNLKLIAGKPLIYYSIKEAQKSSYIDEIFCSTDGIEIADYCKSQGVSVINRPKELAQDTSPTIDCVIHAIEQFRAQNKHFDYLLLLQPTSPLRTAEHINGIIEACINKDLRGMCSVHQCIYNPILVRYMEGDDLKNILERTSTIRRQEMPKTCYVNGMLYLCKTELIQKDFSFNDIPYGYEVDLESSIDINDSVDLELCDKILSNKK